MNITQHTVKELIRYDPETGNAYWNIRDAKWFSCPNPKRSAEHAMKIWNSGWAGKEISTKNNYGYIIVGILGKLYLLHRIIFLHQHGFLPEQVDHINHNRTDNSVCNLRPVSNATNAKNRRKTKQNSSGVIGVYWCKDTQKWKASITVNYKTMHLGRFSMKSDAVNARKAANIKYGFHANHGR